MGRPRSLSANPTAAAAYRFSERVSELMAAALRDGRVSESLIARDLEMSARTLRRHLAEEGTSYERLLDDLRKELAEHYLREPELGIDDVAVLLGFSEARAFRRAFRRWNGLSPAQFRLRTGARRPAAVDGDTSLVDKFVAEQTRTDDLSGPYRSTQNSISLTNPLSPPRRWEDSMNVIARASAAEERAPESSEYPPRRTPEASGIAASPVPLTRGLLVKRNGPGTYDRQKSPEERRDDQRRRILMGAARVFGRDGYAAASVATILECSGVSRGTFYRHFNDLADVFLAVKQEAANLLFDFVEERIRDERDPAERLRAGVNAFLSLVAENADLVRVFRRESPANRPSHREIRNQTLNRFVALIREGASEAMKQGLIKNMPDDLTIYALVVAFEGVIARYLDSRDEARVLEAETAMVSLCFRALR
ncbi:MAG TPA: helix-turn-helix domain-containing protein [Polyangiaceae bacterium]|nr:helix-turn-helix domain-containing protein [Polyangiaceae bacterium]